MSKLSQYRMVFQPGWCAYSNTKLTCGLICRSHSYYLKHSKAVVSKFIVSQARPHQIQQKTQLFFLIGSKVTNFARTNQQMRLLSCMTCSLVPSLPPQLSSLAVRITLLTVIRTASDDSCGGRPGTRLHDQHFCIPVCSFLGISPLN